MITSFDRSHKDKQYFIDSTTYNCPFCKRRNIKYQVAGTGSYNSSNTKNVYFYLIECSDCNKTSFHLSNHELHIINLGNGNRKFSEPLQGLEYARAISNAPLTKMKYDALDGNKFKEMDDLFFYHMPTAFFTIDERIPAVIREPLSEADNCLKSNFLTGASAGLRKAIYKLLQHEGIRESLKHDKRVELLKKKHSKIDVSLMNALKKVHVLTSQELHENDWQDFDSYSLRFLLETTKEVLIEMYVIPDEKKKRDKELSELQAKSKPQNNANKEKK